VVNESIEATRKDHGSYPSKIEKWNKMGEAYKNNSLNITSLNHKLQK
jgi:hypothetical protein